MSSFMPKGWLDNQAEEGHLEGRFFKMVDGFGLWAGRFGIDLVMRRPGGENADSEFDNDGIAEGLTCVDGDSVGPKVEDCFENAGGDSPTTRQKKSIWKDGGFVLLRTALALI